MLEISDTRWQRGRRAASPGLEGAIGKAFVIRAVGVLCALVVLAGVRPAGANHDYDRRSFVRIGEHAIEGRIGSAFVLPGERLVITLARGSGGDARIETSGGKLTVERGVWTWTAPQRPGLYPLSIVDRKSGEATCVNAFVLVGSRQVRHGKLNGYAIGKYPKGRTREPAVAHSPIGYVEVTAANVDTQLSPHFKLGQFICKQDGHYPKYVVIQPDLLTKLERLLDLMNARGIHATTLHVLSGYRAPGYNRKIRGAKHSAHQFGQAADVYVDEDGDGRMDDLNGDGEVDYRDALLLSQLVEELEDEPGAGRLVGGVGSYRGTCTHGPFVHVDVRGYRVRWGG